VYNDGWEYVEGYSRDAGLGGLEPGEKNTCCKTWRNFGDRSNDTTSGSSYIVAICFTDRLNGKDIAGVRLAAHFGLSVTLSTFRILLIEVCECVSIRCGAFGPAVEDIDCMKGSQPRAVSDSVLDERICDAQHQENVLLRMESHSRVAELLDASMRRPAFCL